MAKRKAGLNDIIYELDNEDIEVSSDDEVKESKISRLETINSTNKDVNVEETCIEVIPIDNACEAVIKLSSPTAIQNGGKSSVEIVINNGDSRSSSEAHQNKDEVDCIKKMRTECKTTILNEDIVVDSPGNSDLGVEGCENRTPLITVRFRNKKMAVNYKQQIKAFMLNLIKLHEGDKLGSDNETDLELDIWPEDFNESLPEVVEEKVDNNLFFVDTDPGDDRSDDVPRYRQTSTVISNIPDREPTPPPVRRWPICFNCDGNHQLKECTLPRDSARIANKRRSLPARIGRYHVEDDQKFGHLIPGRISGQLRHALGLKRHELPLHIYRMRLLGYPPGWLEEARISHSGITMFDSTGNAILEADEEAGELVEPGSKDKFDIKKILDFPGFNVPPSPRYCEEGQARGLPPMAEQDSKLQMLQFLAPNAMKAYKRKKLTMFPSADPNNVTLVGQTEMELDSGDDLTEFPSVPPLPDEAPPPIPPPPPPPPTCPPPPPPTCPPPAPTPPLPPSSKPLVPIPQQSKQKKGLEKNSEDDLEVIEVLKVGDIPIPMADFIVIDEDESEVDTPDNSCRVSPSLDDLEAKKQLLLDALEVGDITLDDTEIEEKSDNTIDEITDLPNDDVKENVDKNKSIDKNADKVTDNEVTADEKELTEANSEKFADEAANVDKVTGAHSEKVTNVAADVDEVTDADSEKVTDEAADLDEVTDADSEKVADAAANVDELTNENSEKVAGEAPNVDKVTDVNSEKVADVAAHVDEITDANSEEVSDAAVKLDKVTDADSEKVTDEAADLDKVTDADSENVAEVDEISVKDTDVDEAANDDESQVESTSTSYPVVTQESTSIPQLHDTQESTSNSQIMDTQECTSSSQLKDTQESTSSSQLMDTQESTSSSQPMDTQEPSPKSPVMDTLEQAISQESVTSTSQIKNSPSTSDVCRTPENKTGHVRDTDYGTPVMNIASQYVRVPSDDKFAKNICDVINFVNLPNSTGKYKKISALLKKVKSEVDRIQDS